MRLLVSACLLGEDVRYDGGNKREDYVVDVLGRSFELVRVCPEADAGLPIPREPMRLVGDLAAPRLLTTSTVQDRTDVLLRWIGSRLDELASLDLDGYVCKRNSPSCGLHRVKVQGLGGTRARDGMGLFAGAFRRRFPDVPVEEEGRLRDAALRDAFLERVFAYRRWKDLCASGPERGHLVEAACSPGCRETAERSIPGTLSRGS